MKKIILIIILTTINIYLIQAQTDFPSKYSKEKLISDFNFLFQKLEEIHPNCYAYISKEDFLKRKNEALSKIDKPLTSLEFYKIIAPVYGLIRDSHSQIFSFGVIDEYKAFVKQNRNFPLMLRFYNNKAYIVKDFENKILKGNQVLSINKYPIDTLIKAMYPYYNGETTAIKENFLTDYFDSYLWLIFKIESPYEIDFISNDKEIQHITLNGISYTKYDSLYSSVIDTPIFSYKTISYDKNSIGYVKINEFDQKEKFLDFSKNTFQDLKYKNIKDLIIDLRGNPGGSTDVGDILLYYLNDKPIYWQASKFEIKFSKEGKKEFRKNMGIFGYIIPLRWLMSYDKKTKIASYPMKIIQPPEDSLRFKGNIYVLMDIATFSSALAFCRTIKDYSIGVIVGQETGGFASQYGPPTDIRLPNTRFIVSISYMHGIRPSGIDDKRGVIPDIAIEPDLNNDNILEYTINKIKQKNK